MNSIKKFTIFAGVNGAGKSTLFYLEKSSDLGIRLNCDEILSSLGLKWEESRAQILAGKKLLQLQRECIESGVSCNQETTLCGQSIFNAVKQAKEAGYTILLRYVGVETAEIAKERVRKRIESGGHGISDETIERRFVTSQENFLKIYPLCNEVIIYDNTKQMQCAAMMITNGKIEILRKIAWVNELLKKVNLTRKNFV